MEKVRKPKKFIWRYLYSRRYYILVGFVFECLILSLFVLYKMPKDAISYAVLFSFTLLISMWIGDYIVYAKKYHALIHMKKKSYVTPSDLPETKDCLELEYRMLLLSYYEEKMQVVSDWEKNRAEMLDYYTMWVHQIKTPISAMGLLLQTEETSKKSELGKELFKIEQYVEMVLQFLRLEDGSNDFILKKVDLYRIVRQAVLKYADLFFYYKISLKMEEFHCQVLTDEKWMIFVVEQLLSNALKYTKEGSISIYMDGKKQKVLVIEDTGIGINQEDIPRIFEKGYTGFNGRMNKRSTGIGLYLVKKILTKLSHRIVLESTVGKGTKVFLHLGSKEIDVSE